MASSDVVRYRSPLRSLVNVLVAIFLVIYVIWTVLPLFVMFVSSFKDLLEAFKLPTVGDWSGITLFFDFTPTVKHYKSLFLDHNFSVYLFNSIVASAGSALISMRTMAMSRPTWRCRKTCIAA